MGRIIEAKAVISAEDRTGKAFDSIKKNFRDIGKGAKVSADIGKLGKEAERAAAALKEIERFRGVQASFAQARTTFRTTQAEVARIASALDGARKAAAAFDGVKSFSKNGAVAQEMAAARKQVSDLERQLTSAQRSVKAAATAFESQSAALKAVKGDLSGSGVVIGRLVAEENRLKGAVDGANAALTRQGQLMQTNDKLANGMAAAGRRQSDALRRQAEIAAQSQRMIQGMSAAGRPAVVALPQRPTGTLAGGAPAGPARGGGHGGDLFDAATGLGVGVMLKGAYGKARDGWLDMDEATRRQRAILGINEEQQASLYDQALKIGQDTRFSNPDVVKAQTRVGSSLPEHLKDPKVIAAITENSKDYALAMGTTMDEGSSAVLARMLGWRMDMSNGEKAAASSKHAANRLVQWAKASGGDHNDVMGYTKFGAAPASVGGFSEDFSDALGAQLRRIGYEGSMVGNFVRAGATKLAVPTSKGIAALAASGIDHSDYVTPGKNLSSENLGSMLKLKFGQGLNNSQSRRIDALMKDPDVIGNREEFVPQVSAIVQETLARRTKKGKINAQDAESIAKTVNGYLSMAAESVDIQRLMRDVIAKGVSPALGKYLLGQEHGGRAMALDLKTLDKDQKSFANTPSNRAEKVGADINAGVHGAHQRMIGAIDTFYSKLGKVNDGPLTRFYDTVGNVVDSIANLPDGVLKFGTAAAGAAGAIITFKGALGAFNIAKTMIGGDTALKGSAVALDGSAAALTRAAVALGAKGAIPDLPGAVPGGAPGAGGKPSLASRINKLAPLGFLGWSGLGVGAMIGGGLLLDSFDEHRHRGNGYRGDPRRRRPELGLDTLPQNWGVGGLDVSGGLGATPGAYTTNREKTWGETFFGKPTRLGGSDPTRMTLPLPPGMMVMPQAPAPPAEPLPSQSVPLPPPRPSELTPFWPLPPSRPAEFGPSARPMPALPSPAGWGGGAIPVEVTSLPDRGSDASGQASALNNTLDKATTAAATAANGGKPIEATVKPDQLVAQVREMPPLHGMINGELTHHVKVGLDLNTEMLRATVSSEVKKQAVSAPVGTSGIRSGAGTMPGTAQPPGGR